MSAAPVCELCSSGELREMMRYRAPGLLEGSGTVARVFKCSSCGAISSSSSDDNGQLGLLEEPGGTNEEVST